MAFAKDKSSKYSECIKDFGKMNNAAVHKCASEVSEFLKVEIEHKLKQIMNKIIEKGNFEKKNDLNEFLQSNYHWKLIWNCNVNFKQNILVLQCYIIVQ